jgi:hypothetical protein
VRTRGHTIFGSSTITVGKIKEMAKKGYFPEDEARAPGVKTVPEPENNRTVVYEDFFCRWLVHASASGPG